MPFRDPDTGAVIGVLDITGTEMAVAPHMLALVEATVAAAQVQLRVERLQLSAAKRDRLAQRRNPANAALPRAVRRGTAPVRGLYRNSLQLLGRDQALLSIEGRTVSLSPRHSEMLALLSVHSGWPQRGGAMQPAVWGRPCPNTSGGDGPAAESPSAVQSCCRA